MLSGLYIADLVWRLAKDQPPLVTFEVETKESLRVFKNTGKYFDTLSQEVPKPYRHFMILMQGRLSEGIRKPIQRYINYYNVSLFEDVANDQEAVKLLFEELDHLKVNLDELVTRYLSSGRIDETMSKIFLGIQRGMSGSIIQPKEITLRLTSGEKDDPLNPHIRISTAGPVLLQRMYDAMKTGQTVALTKENGVEIDAPGIGTVRPELVEITAESTPGVLVELETANYGNSLELVLEKVEDNDQYFVLTNAKQKAFYTFNCKVSKISGQVEIDVKYGPENTDACQLFSFFEFFDHAMKENILLFRRANDGQIVMQGPFPTVFPMPPAESMQFLRVLADIQKKTGTRLLMPKIVTAADISTINRLHQVVMKGDIEIDLNNLSVGLAKNQAERILDRARHPEIIEDFQVKMPSEKIELFGQTISVGEATIVVPKAKIDFRKIEAGLNKGLDPVSVEINILPDKNARILYAKWLKRSG